MKGGDPAAPSGTATLLRLHPSHEPYRGKRPPGLLYTSDAADDMQCLDLGGRLIIKKVDRVG